MLPCRSCISRAGVSLHSPVMNYFLSLSMQGDHLLKIGKYLTISNPTVSFPLLEIEIEMAYIVVLSSR